MPGDRCLFQYDSSKFANASSAESKFGILWSGSKIRRRKPAKVRRKTEKAELYLKQPEKFDDCVQQTVVTPELQFLLSMYITHS